jgi:prolipoprotein diacylglyceryltransferase
MGVVGIVSVIPEPMERRTYGMCGVIRFCAAIFLGVVEIMFMISEPMKCHTYGMCQAIRFCAAIFLGLLLLSPALTDAQDLGPLVSVWVWPACGAVMKHRTRWAAAGRGE